MLLCDTSFCLELFQDCWVSSFVRIGFHCIMTSNPPLHLWRGEYTLDVLVEILLASPSIVHLFRRVARAVSLCLRASKASGINNLLYFLGSFWITPICGWGNLLTSHRISSIFTVTFTFEINPCGWCLSYSRNIQLKFKEVQFEKTSSSKGQEDNNVLLFGGIYCTYLSSLAVSYLHVINKLIQHNTKTFWHDLLSRNIKLNIFSKTQSAGDQRHWSNF